MITGWILFIFAIAFIFAGLAIRHVRGAKLSTDDYYTSRNSASTFTATATLVAAMAGAWILFSPAETATWAGITGLTGYAIGTGLPFFAFAALASRMRTLIPNGSSLADYTRLRYGKTMHIFILGITLFYMTVFLTAELTGIALVVNLFTHIPLWLTVGIIAIGTFAYTAHGGIRASIFTDRIQFMIIVPLLVVVLAFALGSIGGWQTAFARAHQHAPALMDWKFIPGIEFGITLMIAILAANMFHQGFWQRVYTCRDIRTARRSFILSGIIIMPMILLPGIFGVLALANGMAEAHSSTALFAVVKTNLPMWLIAGFILLAICLVMSSLDTLMNGLSCTLAAARQELTNRTSGWSRYQIGLVVLMIPSAFIASQGYSVLYLFLIADLVCAAVLIPVFMGMYVSRYSGKAALVSSIAGIVGGGLFFMKPDFSPIFPIAGGGDSLISYSVALGVGGLCSIIAVIVPAFRTSNPFNFETMTQLNSSAEKSA